MFSLNRVHIIGYQTQPIELRSTPTGVSVTDLNLVTPYSFTPEGGETLSGRVFHTVTLWGQLAEIAHKYAREGSQIFVSGRLQTDSWEDAQTKEKRTKTKVVAQELILLDPKGGLAAAEGISPRLTQCLNRADAIGNVTRDPELRTTTSGQRVLTLGVATNERWKSRATGEDQERTEYHNVVCWGDLAEHVAKHVRKGQKVHVAGRVQSRSWQTPQGSKRVTTEIVADNVTLLGVRREGAPPSPPAEVEPGVRELHPTEEAPVPASDLTYEPSVKVEDLPF